MQLYQQLLKELKQLPWTTQVALVILAIVLVLLLAFVPTTGTSVITFLIALKALAPQ